MRRLYHALPGPPAAKVLQIIILVVVVLVGLGFLFEWAGQFLDNGGTMAVVSFLP